MTGHLRRAEAQDLPFIRAVMEDPAHWDKLESYDLPCLHAALSDPTCLLLIWQEAGAPAGYAWLRHQNGTLKLEEFAVAHPGRGQGRAFLAALLQHLSPMPGLGELWLLVAGDNAGAIRFYERAGFRRGALRPKVWHRRRGPVADALRMSLGPPPWAWPG